MPNYFAHGKLMLTGEYAVLRGAMAMAIPTKKGQQLSVEDGEPGLKWMSIDHSGNTWFTANFNNNLELVDCSDSKTAQQLQTLLHNAKKLSKGFDYQNKHAVTTLNFPNNWGLGSSSTLVALVAQWAGCDALQLFFMSMSGSGYDVACAVSESPILYVLHNRTPKYLPFELSWDFTHHIFFVHLGAKQNSANEVSRFGELNISEEKIQTISKLTQTILESKDIKAFEENITKHETVIGEMIGIEPIKSRLFSDYGGAIKSLGAWGGDFILATGTLQEIEYFRQKGYDTILEWDDMIF